jgi:hypothetical protein
MPGGSRRLTTACEHRGRRKATRGRVADFDFAEPDEPEARPPKGPERRSDAAGGRVAVSASGGFAGLTRRSERQQADRAR